MMCSILQFFGEWAKVINLDKLKSILGELDKVNPELLCPEPSKVLKAFKLCPYNKLKMVWIGQDPFPQKGVAQGVLFGNNENTLEDNLSPSLQIIKEACIDYTVPHGIIKFDNTLESWARQGILMLNSALTCKVNKVGSHVILWRPFISDLLKNLSNKEIGIIYVLFGKQAQTFEPYINNKSNYIITIDHPAYFARINKSMPHKLFKEIDYLLTRMYGESIKWFTEY